MKSYIISLITVFYLLFFTTICAKYPIQAHSFNDLDYLRNIINKNVDYFKLDVSMANRRSCQAHSTWSKSSLCLNTTQYVQEICCLAMRGDASSRPDFKYDFNTTDDFVAMLDQVMNNIKQKQPNRKLLFAINFQYDFFFEDFLSEAFLLKLANLLEKYGQNLLLGTGSDSFILEYDRICFGKSTQQLLQQPQHNLSSQLCTPNRKKISLSPLFLQTGSYNPQDLRDHYKRYRNFNVMFLSIDSYCKNGFPTWISKHPQFPLIFWQPSDQNQIQYVLDRFLSPQCMQKHNRTLSGMAMATNIDSEMFQFYMKKSKLTQNLSAGWKYLNEKLVINNWSQNKIHSTTYQGTQYIIVCQKNNKFHHKYCHFLAVDQLNKQITVQKQFSLSDIQLSQTIIKNLQFNKCILLITQDQSKNSTKIYQYDYFTTNLTKKIQNLPVIVAATVIKTNDKDKLIYVSINKEKNKYIVEGTTDFQDSQKYDEFDIDPSFKITSIGVYNGNIIITGDDNKYTRFLTIKMTHNLHKHSKASQHRILTRGTNSQIYINEIVDQIIISVQNSMCHSAILINNNDMNKCTFYQQPEFQDISNVNGLVNIIQISYQNLIKLQTTQGNLIGPCQQSDIHYTKLMNGRNVEMAQLKNGQIFVSSDYIAVEDQDFIGAVFCGGSNYNKNATNWKGVILGTYQNPYLIKYTQNKNIYLQSQ